MPKVCPVCGTEYADTSVFCPADGSTLRAAEAAHDLIGTVIADRYLVTDLLGAGGMGTVYLARHVRLPQQAAIKVLKPELVRDTEAVARFNREAANASRVEHERIARVFDYGESADGTVYLAMEYVPGRTLKQILRADGAQSVARTAAITRQVGDALDAAHRLGIVHRDLKPDNIMVIEDAELGDRCKVVDFGIAKAMGGGAGEPGLTKTGFIVGTPEFMSPEQLFGTDIDHRSDVYALALVAYQCLTGALPFDSSTPERTMTARLVETPLPLAVVRPDVPWSPAVQAVFDQGLAKDREARHTSAGAFARALELAAATSDATPPAPHATTAGNAPVPAAVRSTASETTAPLTTTPASHAGGGRSMGGLVAVAALVGVAALAFLFTRGGDDPPASSLVAVTTPPPSATAQQPDDGGRTTATIPDASAAGPSATDEASRGTTAAGSAAGDNAVPEARRTTSSPAPGGSPATAARPSAERDAATGSAAAAARFSLDSIRIAFDLATATESEARRAVAALRALMPRLGTAEDSVWAYLRQAEAHFLTDDARSACLVLGTARRMATTAEQQRVVTNLSGAC